MSSYTIREITVNPLDPASIDKAIREVETLQDKLLPAMESAIEALLDKGVEIARAELLAFDKPAYDSGELYESIYGEMFDGTGFITADTSYAVYVEYGTGAYASGGSERQDGWMYYDAKRGRFRFTRGMAARPFMYNTMRKLEAEADKEAGRLIAEYLG